MRFSWDFLQNMLENGHSNLQTNLWVHIASNIFKISNSKITGSHQPPWPPNFETYPTPGVGGRFGIFSPKWRERMNLKVPRAILPLGCAILSTRAKTVRGVGTTPLRRTRVNSDILIFPLERLELIGIEGIRNGEKKLVLPSIGGGRFYLE